MSELTRLTPDELAAEADGHFHKMEGGEASIVATVAWYVAVKAAEILHVTYGYTVLVEKSKLGWPKLLLSRPKSPEPRPGDYGNMSETDFQRSADAYDRAATRFVIFGSLACAFQIIAAVASLAAAFMKPHP